MDVNLITILSILKKGKKYFLLVFLLTFAISTTISFLLPVIYGSTAVFFALNPRSYDPRTKFYYMEIYGTVEDVNRNIALAESGEVRDFIIRKYDLGRRYEYDTANAMKIAGLHQEYLSNLSVKETNKGAIQIMFYDRDADTAAYIVNDILRQVNTLNKAVIIDAINKQFITYQKVMKDRYNGLDSLNEVLNSIKEKGNHSITSEVNGMEMFQAFTRLKETEVNLEAIQDDIQTIQVIEKAIPNKQKEKPKRMIIVAIACLSTFILTLLFLLVKDRKDFEEEQA